MSMCLSTTRYVIPEQRGADGDQVWGGRSSGLQPQYELRSGTDRFSLVTGTGHGRRLQADACSQVTSVIISLSNNASDVAYLKQSIKEMRPGGTAPLRCVLRRTCRRSR